MKNFKPILFSTAMVQAIIEGKKTQTRREIKPQPVAQGKIIMAIVLDGSKKQSGLYLDQSGKTTSILPKYQVGDILWVRETWCPTRFDYMDMLGRGLTHFVKFKADGDYAPKPEGRSWKPSIHMPKKACRIFLEVTNVRVERLRDISEKDGKAEGVIPSSGVPVDKPYWYAFMLVWRKIHSLESWQANPWVWVYEFKRVEKPSNF